MKKKISVILPIHNVASFLGDALDSLINQTIGVENLEVIMVNDGSTDESPEIMEKYAGEYDNFKIINLEEKSGAAGKPRNEGLKIATAPYIMFLDPDDMYDKNTCKVMYEAITTKKCDIVTSNYIYMEEDGTLWDKPVFDKKRFKNFNFGTRSFRDSFFIWNSAVWNKIFSKKLILDNKIKFPEGVVGEDAYFSYAALLKTNKIHYISDISVYYRRRNNAATLSVSWDRTIDYFRKMNYVYKEIHNLFLQSKKLELYRYFYAKTLTSIFYKIVDTNIMSNEEKETVLEEMQWFFKQRKKVKIDPCQKTLNIIFDKVDEGNYKEAVDMCKIVAEMRKYVSRDVRENMSKPENINYIKVD